MQKEMQIDDGEKEREGGRERERERAVSYTHLDVYKRQGLAPQV